jgi:hypothetical protein
MPALDLTMKKLIILTLIMPLLFVASCAITQGPEESLKHFSTSVMNSEWDKVWDSISSQSQKSYEDKVFIPAKSNFETLPKEKREFKHPQYDISIQDLVSMSTKDFFILQQEKTDTGALMRKTFNPEALKVESSAIQGNVARIKIRNISRDYELIKEGGRWKICLFN